MEGVVGSWSGRCETFVGDSDEFIGCYGGFTMIARCGVELLKMNHTKDFSILPIKLNMFKLNSTSLLTTPEALGMPFPPHRHERSSKHLSIASSTIDALVW